MLLIKFKKLRHDAVMPIYATPGSAAADIALPSASPPFSVEPGKSVMLPTGLALEPPSNYVTFVFSRSGHGAKNGIRLSNGVAVIDPDYRGELMFSLRNDGTEEFRIEGGMRFVQIICLPFQQAQFMEVSELSGTERGAGGFGSTGAKL